MSRFAFEMPTEAEAREFLDWRRTKSMYQGDLYQDAVTCVRRLVPATDPAERAIAATFVNAPSYPCASCGLYAFPTAGTRCFWCKTEDAKWGAS